MPKYQIQIRVYQLRVSFFSQHWQLCFDADGGNVMTLTSWGQQCQRHHSVHPYVTHQNQVSGYQWTTSFVSSNDVKTCDADSGNGAVTPIYGLSNDSDILQIVYLGHKSKL